MKSHFIVPRFRKLLPFLGHRTKSLALQGFLQKGLTKESLSPSQLEAVAKRCPDLEEIVLDKCYVDAKKVQINNLPKSITKLRIVNSEFVGISSKESYFTGIHEHLERLEVLELVGCGWVSNHSIMAICKCTELKELSLRGCFRIGECFAYTALACRFGFRNLRRADLRDTRIGNSEVPCFGRLPEISSLYLGRTAEDTPPTPSASGDNVPVNPPEGDGMITDRGLLSLCSYSEDPHVSKLSDLTVTRMPGVTDDIMRKLATSLPLRRLDVRKTSVTSKGADSVRAFRPACKVILDDAEE